MVDIVTPSPALASVSELAALAGVTPRTVWRDVKRGVCPKPIRIGRHDRWMLKAAETWLAQRRGQELASPVARNAALPELISIEEMSVVLDGISERTLWRWVRRPGFPPPVDNPLRPRLWRTQDVLDWLDANTR